jgi:hypothetical protein
LNIYVNFNEGCISSLFAKIMWILKNEGCPSVLISRLLPKLCKFKETKAVPVLISRFLPKLWFLKRKCDPLFVFC